VRMIRYFWFFYLCVLLLIAAVAHARDPKQVAAFRKDHPCPSTGKTTGVCNGYVIDHVWSLCLGGPDIPENMKWQTDVESYLKDVFERDMCAMKRKLEAKPKASADVNIEGVPCNLTYTGCKEDGRH